MGKPGGSTRRLFAPEVIQTSAMDCGPASLKCLLEGFGVSASYGRLREACQTDVDGTSIDTIEDIACQLGLNAEQMMVPADHVLLTEAQSLPAMVVVLQPGGLTHFLVVWKCFAGRVQIMDPGAGRRWIRAADLLDQLYSHVMAVPAEAWREFAGTEDFVRPLRARAGQLGIEAGRLIAQASGDESWLGLAALDAAVRFVASLVRSGAIHAGREAERLVTALTDKIREAPDEAQQIVPVQYWFVRPGPPDPDGDEQLLMRGAVLLRVDGLKKAAAPDADGAAGDGSDGEEQAPLSPELVAALEEAPPRPLRALLGLMRRDGLFTPVSLAIAVVLAASAVIVEAILLRGFVDAGTMLPLGFQRLGAAATLLIFLGSVLLLEILIGSGLRRLGRKLEGRLRVAFLEKLPRLADRYFSSRPVSDMAARCHSLFQVRVLPTVGGQSVRAAVSLLLTAGGIIWLDPPSAPLVAVGAALCIAVPLLAQARLSEQEMRFRTHAGALGQFYLDCLLGMLAVRAHGAERSVRREHEGLLSEWARTGYGMQRTVVLVEAAQALIGAAIAIALIFGYLQRQTDGATALLLVYWTLNLPVIGNQLADLLQQYPTHRNVTLRLLEPLGAAEEHRAEGDPSPRHDGSEGSPAAGSAGVAIELDQVTVLAGGHVVLDGVDLKVPAGSHVALVGPSGAGKSSTLGLLLGWHSPSRGSIRIDGAPLDSARLDALRAETAWVDPAVQLWNRSLLENLRYGASASEATPLDCVVDAARLKTVLEKLPEGHQTLLGEGGGLVSGGEGQRVRLGRALARADARMVLLDEPFRGLDRSTRKALMKRARDHWQDSTLLCVTHDVEHALSFDRVIVVDGGRVVEDGNPTELAEQPGSRFKGMLESEQAVRERIWASTAWRRLVLDDGRVAE